MAQGDFQFQENLLDSVTSHSRRQNLLKPFSLYILSHTFQFLIGPFLSLNEKLYSMHSSQAMSISDIRREPFIPLSQLRELHLGCLVITRESLCDLPRRKAQGWAKESWHSIHYAFGFSSCLYISKDRNQAILKLTVITYLQENRLKKKKKALIYPDYKDPSWLKFRARKHPTLY